MLGGFIRRSFGGNPVKRLNMYHVYIIRSLNKDQSYTGITSDLRKRIEQHNKGLTRSTKAYKPWELIHSEKYDSRKEAAKREKYLKSGKGREYIKKLLNR